MKNKKLILIWILAAGFLLIGTQSFGSSGDPVKATSNWAELSPNIAQPVRSGHFSFGFYGGGPYGHGFHFGYHGHYRGYRYRDPYHYRYGHPRHHYYRKYPYRYRYRHRPHYRHYHRGPGYRYRHRW
jgi:hypothetical protein